MGSSQQVLEAVAKNDFENFHSHTHRHIHAVVGKEMRLADYESLKGRIGKMIGGLVPEKPQGCLGIYAVAAGEIRGVGDKDL